KRPAASFGSGTASALAFGLVPFAVRGQQCVLVYGQLIAGKKWNVIICYIGTPRQQQVCTGLVPLADHESQPQAPHWRKRDPYPSISVGRAIELCPAQMRFLGVHETPQLVELAFSDVEVGPQGEHDHTAVACDPLQPSADRVF